MKIIETEVLVVGEGSAGLTAALAASEAGVDVLLLYSAQASSTAISTGFLTYAAHDGFKQGEVFQAMAETTGKGLCDMALLKRLVQQAPIEMAEILARYDIPTMRTPKGFRVRRSTGKRGRDLLDDNYGRDGLQDMTGLMMEFSSTHGTALFSQLRKAARNSNIQRLKGIALSLSREGPTATRDTPFARHVPRHAASPRIARHPHSHRFPAGVRRLEAQASGVLGPGWEN